MMKKVHVIQHTHWDFEWYFTRNEAMIQFVYHMDEVFAALKKQQVDYYLLDGQMSILDDYLDAYPEKKSEIIKWVRAGRLFIGPWYTQTDELIVTGESIIRNLSLGMELADNLGGSQKIGYLPDSFGQGADMPKIYNGMGIKDTVFWRGLPKEKTLNREFNWQAEDGSNVTALNIKNGYFVGVGLIYDDDATQVMKTIVDGTTLEDIALPVGGDQRYVDYDLKQRIKLYNDQLSDSKLVESNYPKLFEVINQNKDQLDTVHGEFITSSASKIHRSIYSSRYDQKYLNDKVERRLIYQLEPLMAMADRIGIPYKKSLLKKIWKLVVRNQAHDSAGGCNSDKTNQIILERLREADQLSYSTVDYLVRKISESEENRQPNDLTFFNPLLYPVTKNINFQVSLKDKNFELFDKDSKVIMDVWDVDEKYGGQIKRDESQYNEEDYYYVFECTAEITIPAMQWKTLTVKTKTGNKEMILTNSEKSIQNNKCKITFDDGKINYLNRQTNEQVENLLTIVDDGDEGDTYDYSPAYNDQEFKLDFKNAEVDCKHGEISEILELMGQWNLPKSLKERNKAEYSGSVRYKLTLILNKNDSSIQVHLLIDNKVKDHRMRAVINTNLRKNLNSYADTAFGYVKRPVIDPHFHDWKEIGLNEEPTAIFPMLHYVNIHDKNNGVTLMTKGIKEYQIIGKEYNQVALTLFRSVGLLGRPDLIRRPGVASGNQFTYIPTPDSQLQQQLHFKFAIQFEEEFSPAKIMRDFQVYGISNPYYQEQTINQFTNTLKYFVMHPLEKEITSRPFVELKTNELVFSSLTESEDESGWLIRVYNPNKFICDGNNVLRISKQTSVSLTDFLGKISTDLGVCDVVSVGDFKPGEIKTIKLNK